MLKSFLSTATILFISGAAVVSAQQKQNSNGPRFLDDIIVEVAPSPTLAEPVQSRKPEATFAARKENNTSSTSIQSIEAADKLQFKFSLLLDTEVEMVQNIFLFKLIDEWMGTRYRLGGNSKMGIDCSALMQILFASAYGISLPRTAREQFSVCNKVDKDELKEGDLVFFNTTGGISHVGLYLMNNKFLHASTSSGVTISDLDEDYWVKKLIGFRRVDESASASSSKP